MRIYVLRHGQSEANLRVAHAGWGPVPLTEKGIAQAKEAGERLKGLHFDQVIVSDLYRAQQTARCALPGREYRTDWRVREISSGRLEGYTVVQLQEELGAEYVYHRRIRDFTSYGGEKHADMQKRVSEFMDDLTKEPEDAQIAVVCHEGAMYCMLCHVMQCSLPYLGAFADNCSICVFTYKDGHWTLNKWNETGNVEPEI